jgi:hypothetical protein
MAGTAGTAVSKAAYAAAAVVLAVVCVQQLRGRFPLRTGGDLNIGQSPRPRPQPMRSPVSDRLMMTINS